MGMPSGTELLIILGIVILLFGGKKIPELAKGLGQGIKNFKKSVKDDEADEVVATDAPKKVDAPVQDVAAAKPSETSKQA